jgi:hypothetical protein
MLGVMFDIIFGVMLDIILGIILGIIFDIMLDDTIGIDIIGSIKDTLADIICIGT